MNNQKGKTGINRRIIVLLLFAVAVCIGALLFLAPVYQGDFVPLPEVSEELEQSARIDLNQADLETVCLPLCQPAGAGPGRRYRPQNH